MLILEVTNAQDQLNLLKRIVDSTWSAIAAEAAAEAAARQQRAAATAAKPRARRAAKSISKFVPKAATAVKPTQATTAEKTAAAIVQHGATQSQPQSLLPQPRRVYPSSTAKPKPIARLGKVAALANSK